MTEDANFSRRIGLGLGAVGVAAVLTRGANAQTAAGSVSAFSSAFLTCM